MHGGNIKLMAQKAGCLPEDLLDFSANINPLGPPPGIWADLVRDQENLGHYPDPGCSELLSAAAGFYNCRSDEILAGNGSTELLFAAVSHIRPKRVVLPTPCYIDYATAARYADIPVQWVLLDPDRNFEPDIAKMSGVLRFGDMLILGRPNNPTGNCPSVNFCCELAADFPDVMFLIDEAFIDLTDYDRLPVGQQANILILRSLTKNFAIPGLRLGLICGNRRLISTLKASLPPWTVSSPAQAVGNNLFSESEYLKQSRLHIHQARESLIKELSKISGLNVFPGTANFLLMKIIDSRWSGHKLFNAMLEKQIAIRVCDDYEGLDAQYVRVAVKNPEDNLKLINAFKTLLEPVQQKIIRKTPAIMLQGTGSNAGKSILTAALCRILLQDGLRVAPFKAQNMSLNSYVTTDGLEMGRAQVTQAMAARVAPDVRMNPVLLKPNSDTGSQVIVRGRSVGHMNVSDYVAYKEDAFTSVKDCYQSLASEYDAMVLEGAGSPGEINLKHHDIVNMRMARFAESPVLLVGDIDRGGVFASFIGTFAVLEPWERDLLAGFIVNRFRGDASLLDSAFALTTRYTGRPTFGVIDYLPNLGLPEEDSVEFKSAASSSPSSDTKDIDIAVIDLPHISNFTDLDALALEPDVSVRIVRSGMPLGCPDLVLLPGSKSVAADLVWLCQENRSEQLIDYYQQGGRVMGICGGFQMLGQAIYDPDHMESGYGDMPGLKLLSCSTTLAPEKTLKRTRAEHVESGQTVEGYEIHHGVTQVRDEKIWLKTSDATMGITSGDGRITGTYLHGIFDADGFRRWFVNDLRAAKSLPPIKTGVVYDLNNALDRLADHVRERIDLDRIYQLAGI
ncbi:MAG: cobyric acid synthase [Desulfobacteraceae bacterium]|jgi:adenosylcobyric acid synthase|nr:cobyric acid synthase [Desulfobacteraceae bacterium]